MTAQVMFNSLKYAYMPCKITSKNSVSPIFISLHEFTMLTRAVPQPLEKKSCSSFFSSTNCLKVS